MRAQRFKSCGYADHSMNEATARKILENFNVYHTHELEGTIVSADAEGFTVEFRGTFCRTCGFYDYFDNLQVVLEDHYGLNTIIEGIDETPSGAIVRYSYRQ